MNTSLGDDGKYRTARKYANNKDIYIPHCLLFDDPTVTGVTKIFFDLSDGTAAEMA